MTLYRVFTRNNFRPNKLWPGGKEPMYGHKKTLRQAVSLEEARKVCKDYNDHRNPGKYGHMAEFEAI